MVAFKALKLSDMTSTQLKSAAKAIRSTKKFKKKSDLLMSVASELVAQGYVQLDSLESVPFYSRERVKMLSSRLF